MEVKLSTGRKVVVRDLTEDQIADLKDIPEIVWVGDEERTIRNTNKAKLAWLRSGIGGGDFEGWKANGVAPPDSVLRQLTEMEKDELVQEIQKAQIVNPKKPSN